MEWCGGFERASQWVCSFIDSYINIAWNIYDGDPGAYTLAVIHVSDIIQPAIPDPGQDCHGDSVAMMLLQMSFDVYSTCASKSKTHHAYISLSTSFLLQNSGDTGFNKIYILLQVFTLMSCYIVSMTFVKWLQGFRSEKHVGHALEPAHTKQQHIMQSVYCACRTMAMEYYIGFIYLDTTLQATLFSGVLHQTIT